MGNLNHPICPIMLNDAQLTADFAEELLNLGIYVVGFSYPVVPQNEARIRIQISAAHSEDNIMYCVNAFKIVGQKKKIL